MLTQKGLEKLSDLEFAAIVLQEKLDRLTNPNTLTAAKLRCTVNHLREMDAKEKTRSKNWWYIQYYGEDGAQLSPSDMDDHELERIGSMISEGYSSGEIYDTGGDLDNAQ